MTSEEKVRITEQLASVRKAIYAVEQGGQSYKIGSRSLTRVNYADLLAQEKELMSELAADDDDNTGLFTDTYAAVFDRR